MDKGMFNTDQMEAVEGAGPIIDPKDDPNFVGGEIPKTQEVLDLEAKEKAEAEGVVTETEEEKLAREALETPEQKQAAIEAKIAEDNKEKTPEEIKALQEASRDTRTDEQKLADAEKLQKEQTEAREKEVADKVLKDLFKRHGVNSEEELKEKLTPTIETEEQKKAKQENYTAALNKYAVENKAFTNDELNTLASLKKMEPQDLVYQQFKKEYQEKYAGRLDEDKKPNPATEDEIRDNFNDFYNIESENEALKEQGQKAIELRAKGILDPLEGKLNDLKAVFDEENRKTATIPEFKKFVQSALTEYVPKEMTFGEGDDAVKVTLNQTNLDDIEKLFVNNYHFDDFLKNGGTAEQRALFKKEIEKELIWQNIADITKVIGDVRHGAGVKLGKVGAAVPFEEQKRQEAQAVDTTTLTDAEQSDLRKAFNRR